MNGELVPWNQRKDSGRGEYPSVAENPDSSNGWGACPQGQPIASAYLATINIPTAFLKKIDDDPKDMCSSLPFSNNPSISLVEWMAAGGGAMNIVYNDQSVDLSVHYIIFNFLAEVYDGVQEDLEEDPVFFEDAIVEKNVVDENLSAEFMHVNKINRDTFLYSSEFIVLMDLMFYLTRKSRNFMFIF